jgi:parvulin-like peptidyl-prolyl isomerase
MGWNRFGKGALIATLVVSTAGLEMMACGKKTTDATTEGSGSGAASAGGSGAAATAAACATIDGKVVFTRAQLDAEMAEILERYAKMPEQRATSERWRNQRRRRIVQKAVQDALVAQHVGTQKAEVTDAEVEVAIKKELGIVFENEQQFGHFLTSHKQTKEEYYAEKRQELLVDKVLAMRGTLEPDDKELGEFYEQNKERWNEGERVLASRITIRLKNSADPASDKEGLDRINQIRTRVTTGKEDFAKVAQEVSEMADKSRGGDLGWVVKGRRQQFVNDGVEAAIFKAAKNTVTAPIKTQLGYEIFQVRDHREAGVRSMDEVRDIIYEPLRRRRRDRLRMELVNELQQKAKVEYTEAAWGLETEPAVEPAGSGAPAPKPMGLPPGVKLQANPQAALPGVKVVPASPAAPAAPAAPKAP